MHMSGESTGASGAASASKRMPDYWFASRSRYFVKNHGIAYARLADIASILGMAFWTLRNALFQRRGIGREKMLRDLLRTSVLFRGPVGIEKRTGKYHDA